MADRSRDKAPKPTFRLRSKSSGPTTRPQPETQPSDSRGPAPDEVVPSTSRQVVGRTTLAGREVAVVSASPKWRKLVPPTTTEQLQKIPPYEDISSGSSTSSSDEEEEGAHPSTGTAGTRHSTESTWYQDLPPSLPQRPTKHARDSSGDSLPPAQKLDRRQSPITQHLSPIDPKRTSSPIIRSAPSSPQHRRDPRIVANEQREAAMRAAGMTFASVASQPPTTTSPREAQAPPPTTTDQPQAPKQKIPPITVETLPNWTTHFRALKGILGHAPNARPMGKGVRFLPKDIDEYRGVQKYLAEAREQDPRIIGHSYAIQQDRAHKVAINGLLMDTPVEELMADLEDIVGVKPEFARAIPPRQGRPGTIFFVQFPHLEREQLNKLMGIQELLAIPNIAITAWVRRAGPPQCHRCQAFGHSSLGCFRPARCVRCAGPHPASDCDREHATIKCANCGQPHVANSRSCPAFRREARKTDANIPPPLPASQRQPVAQNQIATHEPTQQGNLMAQARGPPAPTSAAPQTSRPPKKRKTKRRQQKPTQQAATQPPMPVRRAPPPPTQASTVARTILSQPRAKPDTFPETLPASLTEWPLLPVPKAATQTAQVTHRQAAQAIRAPRVPQAPRQATLAQPQTQINQAHQQPAHHQPARKPAPPTFRAQPPSAPPPLMRPTPPTTLRTDPNGQPPHHRCGCSEERGRLMVQAAITVLLGVLQAVNSGQEPAEAILQGLVHLHTHLRG